MHAGRGRKDTERVFGNSTWTARMRIQQVSHQPASQCESSGGSGPHNAEAATCKCPHRGLLARHHVQVSSQRAPKPQSRQPPRAHNTPEEDRQILEIYRNAPRGEGAYRYRLLAQQLNRSAGAVGSRLQKLKEKEMDRARVVAGAGNESNVRSHA